MTSCRAIVLSVRLLLLDYTALLYINYNAWLGVNRWWTCDRWQVSTDDSVRFDKPQFNAALIYALCVDVIADIEYRLVVSSWSHTVDGIEVNINHQIARFHNYVACIYSMFFQEILNWGQLFASANSSPPSPCALFPFSSTSPPPYLHSLPSIFPLYLVQEYKPGIEFYNCSSRVMFIAFQLYWQLHNILPSSRSWETLT